MNKNSVLKFTSIALSVLSIFIIIMFISSFFIGVGAFLIIEYESGIFFESGQVIFNESPNAMSMNEFAQNNPVKFIFSLAQNLILLYFLYKIVANLKKVIKSINSLKTFAEGNIKAFQNISLYAFIIFCVQITKILPEKISLGFHFEPLIGAALAYVLAEVFKEGHQLMKESELTV